jgi:hypothetical protein
VGGGARGEGPDSLRIGGGGDVRVEGRTSFVYVWFPAVVGHDNCATPVLLAYFIPSLFFSLDIEGFESIRCELLRSKWLYCRDYNNCTVNAKMVVL